MGGAHSTKMAFISSHIASCWILRSWSVVSSSATRASSCVTFRCCVIKPRACEKVRRSWRVKPRGSPDPLGKTSLPVSLPDRNARRGFTRRAHRGSIQVFGRGLVKGFSEFLFVFSLYIICKGTTTWARCLLASQPFLGWWCVGTRSKLGIPSQVQQGGYLVALHADSVLVIAMLATACVLLAAHAVARLCAVAVHEAAHAVSALILVGSSLRMTLTLSPFGQSALLVHDISCPAQLYIVRQAGWCASLLLAIGATMWVQCTDDLPFGVGPTGSVLATLWVTATDALLSDLLRWGPSPSRFNHFCCGNFGVVVLDRAQRQLLRPVLRTMMRVTMIRGSQSAGLVCYKVGDPAVTRPSPTHHQPAGSGIGPRHQAAV